MASKEQDFLRQRVEHITQSTRDSVDNILTEVGVEPIRQGADAALLLSASLPMYHGLPEEPTALPDDIKPSHLMIYGSPNVITHGQFPRTDTIADFRLTDIIRRGLLPPRTFHISSERFRLQKIKGLEWLSRIDRQVGKLIVGAESSTFIPEAEGGTSETKVHSRLEHAKEIEAYSRIMLNSLSEYLKRNPVRDTSHSQIY